MKLLAFAASNSRQSINQQLVSHAAHTLASQDASTDVELLDLNDFEMPIYSADREHEQGIPQLAHDFYNKISQADALLISLAEHNGSYSAAYKNIFDWTSRIDMLVYQNKPSILLSTSPGPGGASNVLAQAKASAGHFAMDLKADFSLPSFFEHFDTESGGITTPELAETLIRVVKQLLPQSAASAG